MILRFIRKIKKELKKQKNIKQSKGKTKYFCVGRNKTGTTSLKKAFEDLGYIVGDQRKAEEIYDRSFDIDNTREIIDYCKTAEVFQDVPFSYYKFIERIDKAYPGSKFILTVRDSTDQWYNSITKFHAKKFGKNNRIPTSEDLASATYVRKGFMLNTIKAHGTSLVDPYNKDIMCSHYEKHNSDVKEYFKNRSSDLLVINLSDKKAYKKFLDFIDAESDYSDFPWKNKT